MATSLGPAQNEEFISKSTLLRLVYVTFYSEVTKYGRLLVHSYTILLNRFIFKVGKLFLYKYCYLIQVLKKKRYLKAVIWSYKRISRWAAWRSLNETFLSVPGIIVLVLLNDVQFTAFSRISPSKCLEKYSCYTVIFSHSRVESDVYKSEQRGKLFEFSLF